MYSNHTHPFNTDVHNNIHAYSADLHHLHINPHTQHNHDPDMRLRNGKRNIQLPGAACTVHDGLCRNTVVSCSRGDAVVSRVYIRNGHVVRGLYLCRDVGQVSVGWWEEWLMWRALTCWCLRLCCQQCALLFSVSRLLMPAFHPSKLHHACRSTSPLYPSYHPPLILSSILHSPSYQPHSPSYPRLDTLTLSHPPSYPHPLQTVPVPGQQLCPPAQPNSQCAWLPVGRLHPMHRQ